MEQNRLTLWLAFAIAIVTATPPTILALAAYNESSAALAQSVETHKVVNSRMTEMIGLVGKSAADAATLAEKNAQHQREGEAAAEEIANVKDSVKLKMDNRMK